MVIRTLRDGSYEWSCEDCGRQRLEWAHRGPRKSVCKAARTDDTGAVAERICGSVTGGGCDCADRGIDSGRAERWGRTVGFREGPVFNSLRRRCRTPMGWRRAMLRKMPDQVLGLIGLWSGITSSCLP